MPSSDPLADLERQCRADIEERSENERRSFLAKQFEARHALSNAITGEVGLHLIQRVRRLKEGLSNRSNCDGEWTDGTTCGNCHGCTARCVLSEPDLPQPKEAS